MVSTTAGREHVKQRAGSPSLVPMTSTTPSSPDKLITSKEVEEATRILFAPDDVHAGRQVPVNVITEGEKANESSAAAAAAGGGGLVPPPVRAPNPSPLTRLHPKPAVHAEILRFGMALVCTLSSIPCSLP